MPQTVVTATRVRGRPRTTLAVELCRQFRARRPGPSIAELAAGVGRRPDTVRRLLEETGIRSRRCLIGFSETEVTSSLAARRELGMSVDQLAADTGIDERRIRARLHSAGKPPAQRHRLGEFAMTVDEMTAAHRAGATVTAIAAQAGSSYSTIRRVLIDAGVEMRPPGRWPSRCADNQDS